MQHRAGAIPDLHPWRLRDGMESGFASQGRMSGLCAAAGHRDGDKPGPWCCHLRILAMSILGLLLFASSSLS